MMPGEGKTRSAAVGRAAHHIGARAVVLDEVHVHRGEVLEGVAERIDPLAQSTHE